MLGGASSYDPKNRILWLQFGTNNTINLFGFDVDSGKLVSQLPDTYYMETMDYDSQTGLIYGIGLQVFNSTSYQRILMTLDSKEKKYNIIAPIPHYFIIESDIGALDVKDRTYFCFLQSDKQNNAPFELLTISLTNGKILNSAVGCQQPSKCPWALEYLNN